MILFRNGSCLVIGNMNQLAPLKEFNFATCTIIVLGDVSQIETAMEKFPLNFSSKVFIPTRESPAGNITYYEVYRVKPELSMQVHKCPREYEPADSVWTHRTNLHGAELSFVYEEFTPFCKVDENGNLGGIMYDIMESLSETLNFTTK